MFWQKHLFHTVTIPHSHGISDTHPQHPLNKSTQAVTYSSSHPWPDHLFHQGLFGLFWVTFPACGDRGLFLNTTWFSAYSWLSRSLTDNTLKWFLSLCSPQSQKREALLRALLCFLPAPLELSLLTKQEQESYRPQLEVPFLTPPGISGQLSTPWYNSPGSTAPYFGMHTETHIQAFLGLHSCTFGWWKEQLCGKPVSDQLHILQNGSYSK